MNLMAGLWAQHDALAWPGWWIYWKLAWGMGCLPYQMGLEDEDGNGVRRLEPPFYLAGLYNSLEVEMGGLHGR